MWGSTEPDTSYDRDPTLMWQDQPGVQKNRIYFGVVSTVRTAANPNVALPDLGIGTSIESPSNERHVAVLGVWTDCNGDGYMGAAIGALREYRRELLFDASLCPQTSGSPNSWNGANNYNGWVTEVIPIAGDVGTDESSYSRDKRIYIDRAAMVWGDYGRLDERPWFRSCALSPQPRGTYSTTGGMINYFDCRADIIGGMNTVFTATGDPLGLRFADSDDARTGTLGAIETFGSEDTQYSAVHVADCSDTPLFRTGTFLNESGLGEETADESGGGTAHDLSVYPTPAEPVDDLDGATVPATFNETNEATFGDCDTSNDRGADFYGATHGDFPVSSCASLCVGESDFNGVNPERKTEADWNFFFSVGNRGGFPVSLIPSAIGGGGSAGAAEADAGAYIGGSNWYGDSTYLSKPGPQIVRTDLAAPSARIADAWWLTFYAHVGSATTERGFVTPGGSGLYGAWHCPGGTTSGNPNGWVCDPNAWYVSQDGSRQSENGAPLARPGQRYHLLDVDCYDGEVVSGVGASPAYYGPAPCP